jgi:hypothetical protein
MKMPGWLNESFSQIAVSRCGDYEEAIFAVVKPCTSELTRRFGEIYACMFMFEEEVKQGINRSRLSLLSDFDGFLLHLFFDLQNGCHMFIRNVGLIISEVRLQL